MTELQGDRLPDEAAGALHFPGRPEPGASTGMRCSKVLHLPRPRNPRSRGWFIGLLKEPVEVVQPRRNGDSKMRCKGSGDSRRRHRPLIAAAIRSDLDHHRCVRFFEEASEPLVVPQLVITEAAYLVGRLIDSRAEAAFLRALTEGSLIFEPVDAGDLRRAADLIDTYFDSSSRHGRCHRDRSGRRLGATKIATLDRRHFTVVRPAHAAGSNCSPERGSKDPI